MVPKAGDLVFVDTVSSNGIYFLVANNVRDIVLFGDQAARPDHEDGLFNCLLNRKFPLTPH